MFSLGSISRIQASKLFPFLQEKYKGRRNAIKEFTHTFPEFVFWIYPDGKLFDARDAHRKNVPKGYQHILKDEPDYGGFLRGRVARQLDQQLIVVYCRDTALAEEADKIEQLLKGLEKVPVPIEDDTLVVSDNGDIYGTLEDLEKRLLVLVTSDE